MAIVREVSNLPDGINPNPDVHIPTARESSPSLASRFVATGGIITTSAPAFEGTQTWNAGGIAFTGMKLNVTDTASAVGSLLMDLQAGGVTQASLTKNGQLDVLGSLRTLGGNVRVTTNSGLISIGTSSDVVLNRDAANTLALRNGAAAQAFNIYNTYTDASNYERALVGFSGGNFYVATQNAGTGVARRTIFQTGGTDRWKIEATGELLAGADNAYDIGASGASRPRTGYFGTSVFAPAFSASISVTINSGGQLNWGAGPRLSNASLTGLRITDNTSTNFVDLTVGASNLLTLNGGLTAGSNIGTTGFVSASNGFTVQNRFFILGGAADGVIRLANNVQTITTDITLSGASTAGASLATFGGAIAASKITTSDTVFLHNTSASLANGAAAQIATMTNGPTAGNPTKWIAINDNGTTRYIPAW
jgi:hypothetical protein